MWLVSLMWLVLNQFNVVSFKSKEQQRRNATRAYGGILYYVILCLFHVTSIVLVIVVDRTSMTSYHTGNI